MSATAQIDIPGTMDALRDYHWPGNVRELQNYVERAVVMAETDELLVDLLPECVTSGQPIPLGELEQSGPIDFAAMTKTIVQVGLEQAGRESTDVHRSVVDIVERELIAQVLQSCGGVQTKAAARLGMNRNTLHKKIKDYGLDD